MAETTMSNTNSSRAMEKRDAHKRPEKWMPPELLPKPEEIPGWAYRWIRIASLGQADPRNLSAKLREGWEPVPVIEQPQMQLLVDPNSRFKDNIEIGGLLLCKTPIEFVEQRNDYITAQTHAQTEAVDNNLMRQSDARMPIFREKKSSTSFGKG